MYIAGVKAMRYNELIVFCKLCYSCFCSNYDIHFENLVDIRQQLDGYTIQ